MRSVHRVSLAVANAFFFGGEGVATRHQAQRTGRRKQMSRERDMSTAPPPSSVFVVVVASIDPTTRPTDRLVDM